MLEILRLMPAYLQVIALFLNDSIQLLSPSFWRNKIGPPENAKPPWESTKSVWNNMPHDATWLYLRSYSRSKYYSQIQLCIWLFSSRRTPGEARLYSVGQVFALRVEILGVMTNRGLFIQSKHDSKCWLQFFLLYIYVWMKSSNRKICILMTNIAHCT